MEIGFSVSIDEFRELDLTRPGKVIGWAIKQGVSKNPKRRARWAWFCEVKGVMIHWPGFAVFRPKPNPECDGQDKRIRVITSYFPG